MTKKEKIIAICLSFAIFLMITSSIYTFYQIKPAGYSFLIERLFLK